MERGQIEPVLRAETRLKYCRSDLIGSDGSETTSKTKFDNDIHLNELLDNADVYEVSDVDVFANIFNGKIKAEMIGDSANKRKFAVPVVDVSAPEVQFAVPFLEKHRAVNLNSISEVYVDSSYVGNNLPVLTEIKEINRNKSFSPSQKTQLEYDINGNVMCSQKLLIFKDEMNNEEHWSQEMVVPSTQELLKDAVKMKQTTDLKIFKADMNNDEYWSQEMVVPSTQELLKDAVKTKQTTDLKIFKNAIETKPIPKLTSSSKEKKRKPIDWIPSNIIYRMSAELFDYVYDGEKVDEKKFLYRKDSIAIEINSLFPGCVIYVERKPYEAKKFWRMQAYCTHDNCRKLKLVAYYQDATKFEIFFDKVETTHLTTISRQVRRYERDQQKNILKNEFPNKLRQDKINELDGRLVSLGSFDEVKSLCVYQQMRSEALSMQDNSSDDIKDVEDMISTDENKNFISNILPRKMYAVYIHSKVQHTVLHKLHCKRQKDGTPITARVDATGNVARDIDGVDGPLLYHALTINVTIQHDRKSSPLPLTEQYNCKNRSKNIALWLSDFIASHHELYDNPPLLLDYIITDFSYANFHAILLSFNSITLASYLNLAYEWIRNKTIEGEFPQRHGELVKIRMCFTHLMHTYADMCERHYGKTKNNKQLPVSKVILEILASMIKANDYSDILKLWRQLSILLKNEFENDEVMNAISEVNNITTKINLDDYEEEKLTTAVDVETLPENNNTLYKNNMFYLEFAAISNEPSYVYGNIKKVKNEYYNPKFLEKFLQRFVPLLPLWTEVIIPNIKIVPQDGISLLQQGHNQPIESYFGVFKHTIKKNAKTLGNPPIKLGRAIKLSRDVIDATAKTIELLIPKSRLNSQKPRKPYKPRQKTKKNGKSLDEKASENKGEGVNGGEDLNVGENQDERINGDEKLNNRNVGENQDEGVSSDEDLNDRHVGENQDEGANSDEDLYNRNVAENPNVHSNQDKDKKLDAPENQRKGLDGPSSFSNAKEGFNKKKPLTPFSYFKRHYIRKIAAQSETSNKLVTKKKTTIPKKSIDVFRSNGLFKDVTIYSSMEFPFIVASKNKMLLNNTNFNTLKPFVNISLSLMEYLIHALPKQNLQVIMNNTKDIVQSVKVTELLRKKTIFLILWDADHWLLFVLNKEKKTFATLNPTTKQQSSQQNYFENFSNYVSQHNQKYNRPMEKWSEISLEYDTSNDDFDSGIYIYHYMMQYVNTGTISKTDLHPDELRKTLQLQIIQYSDNMQNNCLICGLEDGHSWVECVTCLRWLHGDCMNIDVSTIKPKDLVYCPICLTFNV